MYFFKGTSDQCIICTGFGGINYMGFTSYKIKWYSTLLSPTKRERKLSCKLSTSYSGILEVLGTAGKTWVELDICQKPITGFQTEFVTHYRLSLYVLTVCVRHWWYLIWRHKSSSRRRHLGVHRGVPVIFRGSMLNKNPGTCWTSPGQGMWQSFSMCTHTTHIIHMIKSQPAPKLKWPTDMYTMCQKHQEPSGAAEQVNNTYVLSQ